MSGNWKANVGSMILEQIPMTDRYTFSLMIFLCNKLCNESYEQFTGRVTSKRLSGSRRRR